MPWINTGRPLQLASYAQFLRVYSQFIEISGANSRSLVQDRDRTSDRDPVILLPHGAVRVVAAPSLTYIWCEEKSVVVKNWTKIGEQFGEQLFSGALFGVCANARPRRPS